MDFQSLQSDPLAFIHALSVSTASGPRRFADCIAGFQAHDFAALGPSLLAVAAGEAPPIPRFWLERTKGGSKDSDLACALLFLLATSQRCLRIQVAANDSEQADEIRLVIRGLLRLEGELNEALATLIEVRGDRIVNGITGSEAQILTRDARGHGARPDVLIVNELTHIQDEDYASTCFDNLDKMPSGLGIVACNAGFSGSWQERWKNIAVTSPRWYLSELKVPAPWIRTTDLDESRRRNPPIRFNRLWHGVWAGEGDALDPDLIEAACQLAGPCDALPNDGTSWRVVAGLDAGVRRDHTGLAIVAQGCGRWIEGPPRERRALTPLEEVLIDLGRMAAPETDEPEGTWTEGDGRIRLLHTAAWAPAPGGQVDLTEAEAEILRLHSRLPFELAYDPFQSELLTQRLRQRGVACRPCEFTGNNLKAMSHAVLQAFSERKVLLYRDERLLADLRSCRAEEKLYGVRLTFSRSRQGGHGDLGQAFSIALWGARSAPRVSPIANNGAELICWP